MELNKLKFIPFYLISWLPFWVLYKWSDLLFVFAYHIVKYRRRVVLHNLQLSFPIKPEEEINRIEKRFYRHFCDVIFESIKALTISKTSIKKRFDVDGQEQLKNLYAENRNAILYAAHLGNWEWLTFMPLTLDHKCITLFQPLKNAYFNELLTLIRSNLGVVCVASNNGLKTLYKHKQEQIPIITCLIGDQSPSRQAISPTWVPFLQRETAFHNGTEKIARKFNYSVYYPEITKLKRGYYKVSFKLIADTPAYLEEGDLIGRFAATLEENILESPELWLWSHRRWKLNTQTQYVQVDAKHLESS